MCVMLTFKNFIVGCEGDQDQPRLYFYNLKEPLIGNFSPQN